MTDPLRAAQGRAALETMRRYLAAEITERQACDWFGVSRLTLRATLDAARQSDDRLREALDAERLYAAIVAELVVLWGEPSDGVSTQVRPILARQIVERYAALASHPTPACALHVHVAGTGDSLDRCDACGHDLRALCHERASTPTPSGTPDRERLAALIDRHWLFRSEDGVFRCSADDWTFGPDDTIAEGDRLAPFSSHIADAVIAAGVHPAAPDEGVTR